jgi:hypothetical protein
VHLPFGHVHEEHWPANAPSFYIQSVSGDYPDMVRFTLAGRQRRKILYLIPVLAGPGTIALILGHLSDRGFGAVVGGALAIAVFSLVYAAYARSFTVLDERGIRTRWHLRLVRHCMWQDVRSIRIATGGRRGGTSQYIEVEPRAGKPFLLGAPLDATAMRDEAFSGKADQVLRYWSHATRPKSLPPRLGPEEGATRFGHHGSR